MYGSNRYNSYRRYGYQSSSYGRGGQSYGYSRQGYQSGGYQRQNVPRKKSGAKFQDLQDQQTGEVVPIVSAWRVQKGQMYSLYARPYKNTKAITSKSGKHWLNLFVTITNRTTMQVTKTSGLLDAMGKRLYIKEFNLIVSNKGNGGYFGSQLKKQYNR